MNSSSSILGGRPIRKNMLPYGRQWLTDEDVNNVVQALKSDFITQGPKIAEFEEKVAEKAGAKYGVAFSNGTAALHAACFAAGIGKGDEVITSPLTFVASSNCVLYQGGTPVFADVDERTYLLELDKAKDALTERSKAVIAVDFTGQPVNMKAFHQFAKEHGLVFIQDAAHSLGASYDGEPVGSVADMTMFSFHPVKPVTTGEGGVIVTNNQEYYEKLLRFRTHGITKEEDGLEKSAEGPWYYEMQDLGYNYRMTDLQAALGLSQLNKLERFIDRRNEIAAVYQRAFAELEQKGWLKRPCVDIRAVSGWHLYVIRLQLEQLNTGRKEIFEALRAENIGVNVHYIPVYYHPYYQRLGYKKGICPVAEKLYESFITLPLFPKMNDQDVEDVIEAVGKVLSYYANH